MFLPLLADLTEETGQHNTAEWVSSSEVASKFDQEGLYFDGASHIRVPSLANYDWGGKMTVSFLFKRTWTQGYMGMVGNGFNTEGTFEIRGVAVRACAHERVQSRGSEEGAVLHMVSLPKAVPRLPSQLPSITTPLPPPPHERTPSRFGVVVPAPYFRERALCRDSLLVFFIGAFGTAEGSDTEWVSVVLRLPLAPLRPRPPSSGSSQRAGTVIGGGVSDSDGVKPQKWDFATTASVGVWHHAALTYADNVATFYLDGDVMTSTIAMEELAQVANPLYIGAADATREFFVGYIREVCFVKGPVKWRPGPSVCLSRWIQLGSPEGMSSSPIGFLGVCK